MKVAKTITFDVEIIKLLEKEENASKVVNFLLQKHYQKMREDAKWTADTLIEAAEAETISEAQEKENTARAEWLSGWYDEDASEEKKERAKEYEKGVKDGKWRGVVEFYQ